jgi:predicted amidohydrolase
MSETVNVAAVRLAPILGDVEGNRARATAAAADAAARGAGLVVLPELATSGYCFADADEARAAAEPVPGPTTDAWEAVAADTGAVLVGGVCELDPDGRVRNSAVVIGPAGLLAVYRKVHLWGREKLLFDPGDEPSPVVDTPAGRLGLGVCFDLFFPEQPRSLVLAGAEVLVYPVNFSTEPAPQPGLPHLDLMTAMVTAHLNRVHVVIADRCGEERGTRWVGCTVVVDADGQLQAAAPDDDAPHTVFAQVDLAAARDKRWGPYNDVLGDRRPELYAADDVQTGSPSSRVRRSTNSRSSASIASSSAGRS